MEKATKVHSIEEIFQLVGAAMCNVNKALVQKKPALAKYAIASLQGVDQICIQGCGIYQAVFSFLTAELGKIAGGDDDHETES